MKKTLAVVLPAVVLSGMSLSAHAATENYTIDPFHTYPNFTIDHLGYSTMYGRFGKTSGSFRLDRDRMTGSVDIRIDAASVDTGMKKRDDHLRSPDFLNVAEFPDITYSAKNVKLKKNGTGKVKGTLTMMGVSKPVTLEVTHMHCATHPFDPTKKKFVCGF
ncbi:MAG: polyisoprenoid-binding protein, partial [Gammaproteobacteria bacterium]|nr:polyisoprenoid-binding protein [Gammaproteobacteria bacterium]